MIFTQKSSDSLGKHVLMLAALGVALLICCSEAKFVDPVVSDPDFKIICGSCDQGRAFLESDTLSGIVSIKVDGPFAPDMEQVKLFIDDVQVATGGYLKLEYDWQTSGVKDGSIHTLYAEILDEQGAGVKTETVAVVLRGTAPAKITDLVAEPVGTNSIMLRWTATGDDGDSGRATSYLIRSFLNYGSFGWDIADDMPYDASPAVAGAADSFLVTNIRSNIDRKYWIVAIDELGNASDTSNIATAITDPLIFLVNRMSTPDTIRYMRIADFNNDGYDDIVGAEHYKNVHVWLSNPLGQFNLPSSYQISTHLWDRPILGVELFDIDLDQDLDIVVNDSYSLRFSIFYNDGSGGFDSTVSFRIGNARSIALGDVNGDNWPDLLAVDVPRDSLGIFINSKDGLFEPMYPVSMGENAFYVGVCDLTGDGKNDLLVGIPGKYPRVYSGNNSGLFDSYYEITINSIDPIVHDMDNDGDLDILFDAYKIHYNDNGVFSRTGLTHIPPGPARALALGDFNNDGFQDIVQAGRVTSKCLLYGQTRSDGSFYAPASYGPLSTSQAIATGDFNGDGQLDIAASTNDLEIMIFMTEQ